jgi:hypothetical protein
MGISGLNSCFSFLYKERSKFVKKHGLSLEWLNQSGAQACSNQ